MSVKIRNVIYTEGVIEDSAREIIAKRFSTNKNVLNGIQRDFNRNASTTTLVTNESLDSGICDYLNRRYPELVSSDPMQYFKLLKKFKTLRNRYPFHKPYAPLRIGSLQDIPNNSSAIESIGAMITGFVCSAYIGWPICRCVGTFPDFIYRTQSNRYVAVESKATTSSNLNKEITTFFKEGISELVAGVCDEAAIVTTVIVDLDPIVVDVKVTKFTFRNGSGVNTQARMKAIYPEIEHQISDDILSDPSKNTVDIVTDILRGDKNLAQDIVKRYESDIENSVRKETRRREKHRDTKLYSGGESNVRNLPSINGEYYPLCPEGSSPVAHSTTQIDGKRYFKEGKYLVELEPLNTE